MKVIFGIGNPDDKYASTRHNVGWMLVDLLSQKVGKFRKAGFEFEAAEGRLDRAEVALVKSWTYVNLSGRVMPELAKRYGDLSTDLLVVCDEIQLPLGAVRLRKSGSAGGHNGLKSIIGAIGDVFPRMRLGVGGPAAAAHPDYVLGKFSKAEQPEAKVMVEYAAEAATCWAVEGMDKAMTKYNRAGGPEDKDAKDK